MNLAQTLFNVIGILLLSEAIRTIKFVENYL